MSAKDHGNDDDEYKLGDAAAYYDDDNDDDDETYYGQKIRALASLWTVRPMRRPNTPPFFKKRSMRFNVRSGRLNPK